MFKKIAGVFLAVSVFSTGIGSIESEASQWNDSSINLEQYHSGDWKNIIEIKKDQINEYKNNLDRASGAVQKHSVYLNGYQLQVGTSNGEAAASQSADITIDVGDETSGLKQTTQGSVTIEQSASSTQPAYVLQSQRNSTNVYHFQASIEGGPAIQNQISQIHSYQYSSFISK